METIWQDVRYALRTLCKSPGFTLVAVLTLALGIGANTAIFSVVEAVLLKPLPIHDPDNVVELWETESAEGNYPLTGADYLDWRSQNKAFEDMSVYSWPKSYNASGVGQPEQASVVEVQANFFSLLGVQPHLGRGFLAGDDNKDHSHIAVLSNAFWKTHFGARSDALGKSVVLNGETYSVVGVMPAWYSVPGTADLWVPIDASLEGLGPRGEHHLRAMGRIKSGVTLEQARVDLRTIASRLEKQYPDNNRSVTAVLVPLKEELVGTSQSELWTLFGAVGLVLLIACVNVANLLLARSTGRRREIALRGALGATRGRLVRQLLTESVMLSLLGGVLGLALAYNGVELLRSMMETTTVAPNPIGLDLGVLLFTLAVSIGVGVLFGLAPAMHTAETNLSDELKARGQSSHGATIRSRWLRDTLVAVEIALSLALLVGAGLLLRTFANLRATDVGVRAEHVLTAYVLLPQKKYGTMDQTRQFYDRLLAALQSSPGIRQAAISSEIPLQGGNNGYISVEGKVTGAMEGPLVEWNSVSPAYFRTLGIPLLQGREFNGADLQAAEQANRILDPLAESHKMDEYKAEEKKIELVSIISRSMAQEFWPGEDPVGKIYRRGDVAFRVIGVAGDVKLFGLRQKSIAQAYFPLTWSLDNYGQPFSVVVQSAGAPESAIATVRAQVRALDDRLALIRVRTMPQLISASMTATSYQTMLLGIFGALALLLAAVGTYGVMSYVVAQRTNEIGIRVALGAQPAQILGMVLRQGMVLAAAGIGVGLLFTLGAARLIRDLLVGVAPVDPFTYASVSALLAAVALLACYVPARRAMQVDPMVALRDE